MTEIQELEATIAAYQDLIKDGEKIQRLKEDALFKEIILEGYCVKKCADYVASSTSDILDESARALALEAAKSAGHLRNYLDATLQMANVAKENLPEIQDSLDKLRNADAEE